MSFRPDVSEVWSVVVPRLAVMLVGTSVLAFAVIRAMPGDPAEIALAAWNVAATPETVEALHRQWGLDQGLVAQYFAWLGRFVAGDWGQSFRTGQPILVEFVRRFPVSAVLGFGGLAIAAALAVPLGFLSARRPGGAADMLARALNVLHQSVPSFWIGLVLLWLLGVKLQLIRPFADEGPGRFALPILIVALYSLGALARVYRAELIAVTHEPFFMTARAKGLSEVRALWAHGHRAALFAMVVAIVPEFAWVVGGTAVIEVVFALPGISQFLVQSVAARDYFVLQAYVVVIAAWMLGVNLAVAAALRWLDPRIR
jgi:peptide/nickel transport system permease protein